MAQNLSSHMALNVAAISFDDAHVRVGVSAFTSPDDLRAHRRMHVATHVVLRRDDKVLSVPVSDDAEPVGTRIEEIELRADLGLCANLVREALMRHLHGLQRKLLDFDPVTFLGYAKGDDLFLASTPSARPGWLDARPKYELSVRRLGGGRSGVRLALAVDLHVAKAILPSCDKLIEMGVSVKGRYVQRLVEREDFRIQPKRRLVGRVADESDSILLLDDHDAEITKIATHDAYLEPNQENFALCLDAVFGSSSTVREALQVQIDKLRSGEEILRRVQATVGYLKKQKLELVPGVSLSFGELLVEGATGFPRVYHASKPIYVFDPSGRRTDSWHDRGLETNGPYDRTFFEVSTPRIAVVCQAARKGSVEQFLHKFLEGMPSVVDRRGRAPFGQGLSRKYHLNTCEIEFFVADNADPEDYLSAARHALEKSTDEGTRWTLALVQIDEVFRELAGDENPYLVTKAFFLEHSVPVQEFTFETTSLPDQQLAYVANNMALASYAKMGGVPWLLKASPAVAHELVFGLGSAIVGEGRFGSKERVVGITTVFSGDGNYILETRSKAVPLEQYPSEILDSLRKTVSTVQTNLNWQPHDPVRLVFHVFKPLRNAEVESVKAVMRELGDYEVEYAFLHVVDEHPFMVLDEAQPGIRDFKSRRLKGRFAPRRGVCLNLSPHEVLMTLVGANELKSAENGHPDPILLHLHRDSTFTDMEYLSRQAFWFSCHSWRSFFPSPLPITILYSQLIAHLLGNLSHLSKWDPDLMIGRIGRTRWFL